VCRQKVVPLWLITNVLSAMKQGGKTMKIDFKGTNRQSENKYRNDELRRMRKERGQMEAAVQEGPEGAEELPRRTGESRTSQGGCGKKPQESEGAQLLVASDGHCREDTLQHFLQRGGRVQDIVDIQARPQAACLTMTCLVPTRQTTGRTSAGWTHTTRPGTGLGETVTQ